MQTMRRTVVGARGLLMLLAASLLAACGSSGGDAPVVKVDPQFEADQQQWRTQRYQDLIRADGWTSLIGLHWLEGPAHWIGSGPGSGIRLSAGPARLGMLRREGMAVSFTPEAGVDVSVDGEPVRGRIPLHSDHDPQPTIIAFDEGKGLLSLIRRGDRLALRVKHADAVSRTAFAGIDYWPGGPDWTVDAMLIPAPPGRTLSIVDITGMSSELPAGGTLQFQRDGVQYALEAIAEPGGELFVIFADRTSGHGSYPAARYIDVPPAGADGRVKIDFNRAYNPPCAFTPYATCPLPPAENRLDLRVEAGEKNYRKPEETH